MTPKEKAKELLWKYLPILESWKENNSNKAKQCAIIAANEALNADWFISEKEDFIKWGLYWEEVKKEIENL